MVAKGDERMNTDTGEIREFADGIIPEGNWVEWNLHETVEVKGCKFIVKAINIAENTITLKGLGNTVIK